MKLFDLLILVKSDPAIWFYMKAKASISRFCSVFISKVKLLSLNRLLYIGTISALLAGIVLTVGGCGQPRSQIKNMEIVTHNSHPVRPGNYIIGPGDELEILYQTDPEYFSPEYFIGIEDSLRVEFYYYPGLNKTVRVRPDGIITLNRIGDLKVVGMKTDELAQKISELYQSYLTKPLVTVELLEFNVRLKELKKAVTTAFKGQSRVVIVRPDGMISLPYIKEVRAAGSTCPELSRTIEKKYAKFLDNINIVAAVLQARSNRTYIMGAVKNPNYYELIGPTSLSQLIAMAGGFTKNANINQVVVISQRRKKEPVARVVDIERIIGKSDLISDPLIYQYDVVFVPDTTLSKASLFSRALWNLIPLFFNINIDYMDIAK